MKEIKREIYGCLCIKTNKWYVGRAIKECNLNRGTLGKVLKGKGKSCGGFIWKYKEEKRNID